MTDPLKQLFRQVVRFEKPSGDALYAHQRYAVEYMKANPGKSVGLFFEAGTGKTIPAVMHALHTPSKRVVYMGPASLHTVFRFHLEKIGGDPARLDSKGQPFFATVTSNASNVYEQWKKAVEPILGPLPSHGEKSFGIGETVKIRDETGEPRASSSPDVICIMDEAHLFSTRVAGILVQLFYGSSEEKKLEADEKQAYKLYRHICRDPRVQLVALSGTPVHNHPFNSVPLFNMLRKEFSGTDGRRALAFTEKFSQFYDGFLRGLNQPAELSPPDTKEGGGTVADPIKPTYFEPTDWAPIKDDRVKQLGKKMDLYAMRIRGLGIWFESPKGLEGSLIPAVEADEVIRVKMSDFQWVIYDQRQQEEKEIEERLRKKQEERSENEPIADSSSVFQSMSQQTGNYGFPRDFYLRFGGEGEKMMEAMPDEGFTRAGFEKHGCKFVVILDSVFGESDRIHAIFSHYVRGPGIATFVRALKLAGCRSLNDAINAGKHSYEDVRMEARSLGSLVASSGWKGTRPFYFMVLTGDETEKMREEVVRISNHPDNAKDRIIRVFLYSGAASHGLTFKSVERVHFLESLWDEVEYTQAIDRTVRIRSAEHLPPDRRKVKVARYLAVAPFKSIPTADEKKLALVARKMVIESFFVDVIKSNAINCQYQLEAESQRDSELIGQKKPPPTRTFFRCEKCTSAYEPSSAVQEAIGTECKTIEAKAPVGKVVKLEGKILDPSTGLIWDSKGTLVTDANLVRALWIRFLGK
jgi:hypothetical protein